MKPIVVILISFLLFSCKKNALEDACQHDGIAFENPIQNDSVKVFIPTAFTPNADGFNDVYYFVTKGIVKFDVKIKKGLSTVFEVNGANSDWRWDGSNLKGEIKDGEYKVEATLYVYDGEIIHLTTKIASAQDYYDLPCSCTKRDQIDPDLGFISQSSEGCID